jgi:hypothetical protein
MFRITKKPSLLHVISSETKKSEDKEPTGLASGGIFDGLQVFILPNGLGKNRAELFRSSLIKNGARILDENKEIEFLDERNDNEACDFSPSAIKFLIVFDETTISTWEMLCKSLAKKKFFAAIKDKYKSLFDEHRERSSNFYQTLSLRVVNSVWLSECLKQKKLVDTFKYELRPAADSRMKDSQNKIAIGERFNADETANKGSNEHSSQILLEQKASYKLIDLKRNSNKMYINQDEESGEENNKRLKKATKKEHDVGLFEDNDDSSNHSGKMFSSTACSKGNWSDDSSYTGSSDEERMASSVDDPSSQKTAKSSLNLKSWTCSYSSKEQLVNHNKYLTDKLEEMSTIYENTKDKYRALGYTKAIQAIKRYPKEITSFEVLS